MGLFDNVFDTISVCFCNLFGRSNVYDESCFAEIEQGRLRGKKSKSVLTKEPYYCFFGIPYAKPPVGNLRFLPPQDPNPWYGVYDATYYRGSCLQKYFLLNTTIGSEDCLYLNIYTPKPPCEIVTPLAVMVFIHGGCFYSGSGSRALFSPDFLIHRDIILVTFNFRLHVFGFLNLEIPECPGNVGLKDVVQVLKWIQKNIRYFGGDSGNVTLFGSSAGAIMVDYLQISPLSQGLFHKVILQSATVFAHISFCTNPIEVAFRIARRAGYTGFDRGELLNFMKTTSARKLTDAFFKELREFLKSAPAGLTFLRPSLEKIKEGAFLPDPPYILARNASMVPCISGVTKEDGFILLTMEGDKMLRRLEKNFGSVLKDFVQINSNLLFEKAGEVRRLYFNDNTIDSRTLKQISAFFTDTMFYRFYEALELRYRSGNPVYLYKFSYTGSCNYFLLIAKFTSLRIALRFNVKGATHGDELFYLFRPNVIPSFLKIKDEDLTIINKMTEMWTNFAKTGSPSSEKIQWERCTRDNFQYLNISSELDMHKGEILTQKFQKLHDILDSVTEKVY